MLTADCPCQDYFSKSVRKYFEDEWVDFNMPHHIEAPTHEKFPPSFWDRCAYYLFLVQFRNLFSRQSFNTTLVVYTNPFENHFAQNHPGVLNPPHWD